MRRKEVHCKKEKKSGNRRNRAYKIVVWEGGSVIDSSPNFS